MGHDAIPLDGVHAMNKCQMECNCMTRLVHLWSVDSLHRFVRMNEKMEAASTPLHSVTNVLWHCLERPLARRPNRAEDKSIDRSFFKTFAKTGTRFFYDAVKYFKKNTAFLCSGS